MIVFTLTRTFIVVLLTNVDVDAFSAYKKWLMFTIWLDWLEINWLIIPHFLISLGIDDTKRFDVLMY